MNTWFEIILMGDDAENLRAAGEAALDEVERIEKLLSRFDPASEVSRINRDAAQKPVLVDFEMAGVLETCRVAWQQSNGFFDITASNVRNIYGRAKLPLRPDLSSHQSDCLPADIWAAQQHRPTFELDVESRLVSFHNSEVRLDFGAFGKGYALDRAADCLRDSGVKKALLHGGTSSVLAIGSGVDDEPWRIGLRNSEQKIELNDAALSTSATGEGISDILDFRSHTPIQIRATCSVITKTAAHAEILSTALLCMGKERATSFLAENNSLQLQVFWTDDADVANTICL